jgi:hypothetical protein
LNVARVLARVEDDPIALYAALREIRSMAGDNVVTQITSYIQAVEARREAEQARREAEQTRREAEHQASLTRLVERVDGVQRELRLIWRVLFAALVPLVALAVRDLVVPLLQ